MQPLPTEIVMLAIGVVLLMLQLFLQSISSTAELGGVYKAGPRDETGCEKCVRRPRRSRLPQSAGDLSDLRRLRWRWCTGRNGGLGALGAEVWVVRAHLYVPLYFIQIPFARSLVWFVSIFALVAMLVRLFQ